jgi:hypothetical protein
MRSRQRRIPTLGSQFQAERVGFEPTVQHYPYNRLASDRLRPLGHLSDIRPIRPIRPMGPIISNNAATRVIREGGGRRSRTRKTHR